MQRYAVHFFTSGKYLDAVDLLAKQMDLIRTDSNEPPRPFDEPVAIMSGGSGGLIIRGTDIPVPIDALLYTKYAALCDTRECFDAVRWNFMVSTDADSQVMIPA